MQSTWQKLANSYEASAASVDSIDTLLDYPAQKRAMGDIRGLRVLDIACGSGRKALDLATQGAREVVGIDISHQFIDAWSNRTRPKNLNFYIGDISSLENIEQIRDEKFDLVICFQALSYSTNIPDTIAFIRSCLNENGRFVLTVPHPLRFALEKSEAFATPVGSAYQEEGVYRYPSLWDNNLSIAHQTPKISSYVNLCVEQGFRLDAMHEPELSAADQAKHPQKAKWLAQYIGLLVFEFSAV